MTEWPITRLGDLISIKHGWPFEREFFSEDRCESPIVVTIGNFRYTGGFRFESTSIKRYIGSYPQEYELSAGDILLIMTCQTAGGEILGIPGRVPQGENYLHNQRLGKVVVKNPDLIASDYLYWLFSWKEFNRELVKTASGSKILHTSPSRIENFRFHLPSLSEQQAIAHILGSLDDKIELNRQMNETLEAMARALFKDWFVDFGPVRAKMAGQQPPGLAADIAALFPDTLDDEGKPVGWKLGNLTDIANLNPESWNRKNSPTEIDYVDLANTKWGTIETITSFHWEDAPSRAQRILRIGDTIIGTVRPGNGSYAYINVDGLTGSTGFAVLRPKSAEYRELLYLSSTEQTNIDRLSHLADGGAYPAIRPDIVASSQINLPMDKQLIFAFSRVISPLMLRIEHNKGESQTLVELRDLLLPKLLSGSMCIKNVQKIIGDTL